MIVISDLTLKTPSAKASIWKEKYPKIWQSPVCLTLNNWGRAWNSIHMIKGRGFATLSLLSG